MDIVTDAPGIMSRENWIADLPATARQAIAERMIVQEMRAGAIVREAGSPAVGLYQLEAGYLKLVADHADGRRTLILIYRPGNAMSESTLVADRAFHHTMIALTDARVRLLPRDDFWDLYHRHPSIPDALCRKFANAMSRLLARRELSATRRLRQMVAFVFGNLADHCGTPEPDGSVTVHLPITQSDLAEHLEVTRQAVQREVGLLKTAGVIDKHHGLWRITDPEALRRAAE